MHFNSFFFYSSRDSIASHLRSHGNIAKEKNEKSVGGVSGAEMKSSQTLSKTLKNRKRKQGKQPPTKTEPRTCLECGWVSKSRLLHDRHLLATHGIQVPQVCIIFLTLWSKTCKTAAYKT